MGNMPVTKCSSYTYLGTEITAEPLNKHIAAHVKIKESQALKFYSFLNKNFDAPYTVKKQVWTSALISSIMFSCETWLTKDFTSVNRLYNDTLKNMLGVRRTTCNDILYIETGIPDAKTFIQIRQKNFLNKLYRRTHFRGSY